MNGRRGSRRFHTDGDTLAHLRATGDDAGLVLGRDDEQRTVVLPLFTPSRTATVAIIGDNALARVVVYRCLALGARVVVESRRPGLWTGLTAAAALPRTTLAVVPPNRSPSGSGTPNRPHLQVMDVGASSRLDATMVRAAAAPGGWTCRLLVVDDLEAADVSLLGAADALIVSSLTVDQAESLVGLVQESGAVRLSRLDRGSVLLIGSGTMHDVTLSWTAQERAMVEGRPA